MKPKRTPMLAKILQELPNTKFENNFWLPKNTKKDCYLAIPIHSKRGIKSRLQGGTDSVTGGGLWDGDD